ncbi:UNVERIFIED_CONTAM: hypothetical protein GTU68_064927 [Idotea baltica]|nr:hypothetical protein [Idotea baltica]
MVKAKTFPFLVADVGGTNARFGLVTGTNLSSGCFIIEEQHVFDCAKYNSFESVLGTYLGKINAGIIQSACIAIAAPVTSDRIVLTNLSWEFSIEATKKKFNLANFEVINDFAAQAYATLHLIPANLKVLTAGTINLVAPRVIIGPGTGLGIAGLINMNGRWHSISGEGGHISYAPTSAKEVEVLKALGVEHRHVSVENLLSGPGLIMLYTSLCEINGRTSQSYDAKDISANAMLGNDADCVEALSLFCRILGSTAGDAALLFGAFGGVYLSGGILPKIEDFLFKSDLVDSFQRKGVMRSLMESVPISLITSDKPALFGAAHWFLEHGRINCN